MSDATWAFPEHPEETILVEQHGRSLDLVLLGPHGLDLYLGSVEFTPVSGSPAVEMEAHRPRMPEHQYERGDLPALVRALRRAALERHAAELADDLETDGDDYTAQDAAQYRQQLEYVQSQLEVTTHV